MKLAAVVIWFNPSELGKDVIIKNIHSYISHIDKMYIVDNSEHSNEDIASLIPNTDYILNKNVGGIGKALNIGCQKAKEDGFDWIMTMDQDSVFQEAQLSSYLELCEKYMKSDEAAASFSPLPRHINKYIHWSKQIRFRILSPLKRKLLGKRYKPFTLPDIMYPEVAITSANIINLLVWKAVGGFDEILIVEQVDVNFCRKLKEHNYNIIQFNTVTFDQKFGEKNTFSLFPKNHPKYGSFRLYYIFRNLFIEKFRFPQEKYRAYYAEMLRTYFFDYCINSIHAFRNFKIFIKAYKDFKKMESLL